ncbi:penicillin-binding transpeptidase domain-containing protein [Desulfurobacterium sp.]
MVDFKRKEQRYWFFAVAIVFCIVVYPYILNSMANIRYSSQVQSQKAPYESFLKELTGNFTLQFSLFKKAKVENGRYVFRTLNGTEIVFTINPEVQKSIKREFKRYKLKYGAFVAIEPSTGKVVAAVSSIDYPDLTVRNTFVTASTFKIVTAAAALESGIDPDERLVTRGHDDSCSPEVWFTSNYVIPRNMFHSFAYSSNPYFGILGRIIGEKRLLSYAHRFGFNRKDYGFPWGIVRKPLDDYDLALIAAGLGETRTSPFHEALISATVENAGVMVLPSLIEEVRYKGKVVYRHRPKVLERVIRKETAATIRKMMIDTVKFGTASDKRLFRRLKRYSYLVIGGKTGTLSQLNYPEGRCEWFTGFVEDGNKKLAIASVAVNDARYYITGYEVSALGVLTMLRKNLVFAEKQ